MTVYVCKCRAYSIDADDAPPPCEGCAVCKTVPTSGEHAYAVEHAYEVEEILTDEGYVDLTFCLYCGRSMSEIKQRGGYGSETKH